MEFENPISIKELKTDSLNLENRYGETGTLVACRPCDEQYKDKTYLGFYLGELPAMQWPSIDKDEQKIQMMTIRNPAMFVCSGNRESNMGCRLVVEDNKFRRRVQRNN